jgi:hypothetical protein
LYIVYEQPLVSSLSAGDCLVHRLRKDFPFLTGAQDSHLLHIYNYDMDLLMMGRVNAQNMKRSLINVLYVNKQEFSASSWRSNESDLLFGPWCHTDKLVFQVF